MVRLKFSVELNYEVAAPGCDFIFNIHAAHTRHQRVVTEMMDDLVDREVTVQMVKLYLSFSFKTK